MISRQTKLKVIIMRMYVNCAVKLSIWEASFDRYVDSIEDVLQVIDFLNGDLLDRMPLVKILFIMLQGNQLDCCVTL